MVTQTLATQRVSCAYASIVIFKTPRGPHHNICQGSWPGLALLLDCVEPPRPYEQARVMRSAVSGVVGM